MSERSDGDVEHPELVRAMLDPAFYPNRTEPVELRETHISWVFLAGGLAYKVKKPLRFPFLDYGTLERRHRMCREEVRLNLSLAPDYYLGVGSIARRDGRLELAAEDDRDAVEYVVEMRAIPQALTLDRLAHEGALTESHIDAVAERLVRFHGEAPPLGEPELRVSRLLHALEENLQTLRSAGPPTIAEGRLLAAERFTEAFLDARRGQLEERAQAGLVRDGHGDLRAEHVILTDPVQIFDRIEFDPALRETDVAADLAFLVMDLGRLGAWAHARRLPVAYREAGGDPGDERLISFLAAYRAWVRAKVACLRAAEPGAGQAEVESEREEAQRLHALGHRFAWRARLPFVLFICGAAASGKTTLAREVAALSGLPQISSDVTRKRLAGLAPTERAAPEQYTVEFNRRTYHALGAAAAREAAMHGGAVVDATARKRADRDAFRAGLGDCRAAVLFVRCRAPASVLLARARLRQSEAGRVSDAGPEVVERQIASFEPLEEVPEGASAEVPTDRSLELQLLDVEGLLDAALAR
ncbi:MAG: bifunctional aminoglycoside phosphotransferase/ATP-binding protein [Solirubrobacterales bacterium]